MFNGIPSSFSAQYWQRLVIFTVSMLLMAGLGLFIYFVILQIDLFVTPKRNTQLTPPVELSPAYQDVMLTAADGVKISGWYIPGTQPAGIVLVHGIHANRMAVLPEAKLLSRAGYHLLLIDLRGHGRSEGNEVTYGYREAWDVQAVDYLAAVPGVEQVGALGTSLGGAAVARAAALDPRIKVVVIESSYSSLPDAIEDAFDNFSIFPKQPFAPLFVSLVEWKLGFKAEQVDSARDLATLSPRAVFILHGTDDGLFPVRHALKMYEAAQPPKELWLIDYLGHANPTEGREIEYQRRIVTFFKQAFAR